MYLGVHDQSPATSGEIAEACSVQENHVMMGCNTCNGSFAGVSLMPVAYAMIGARDSEDFRKRLLNEAGVAVLAAIHFGPRVPGEGRHIRFSYAAPNEAIKKGVAPMANFIGTNAKAKKTA